MKDRRGCERSSGALSFLARRLRVIFEVATGKRVIITMLVEDLDRIEASINRSDEPRDFESGRPQDMGDRKE